MITLEYLLPFLTRCIELAASLAFIFYGVRMGFRAIINAAEGHWYDIWG